MVGMTEPQDLTKLTVPQLKKELQAHNLPVTGVKAALVERLTAALAESSNAEKADVEPAAEKAAEEPAATAATSAGSEPVQAAAATGEPSAPMTDAERIAARVKKFGDSVLTAEEKCRMRQERFHTVDPVTDEERIKARAARFKIETEESKADKLLDRAKRFKIDTPELAEEAKRKREERFKKPVAAPAGAAGPPLSTDDLASLIVKRRK